MCSSLTRLQTPRRQGLHSFLFVIVSIALSTVPNIEKRTQEIFFFIKAMLCLWMGKLLTRKVSGVNSAILSTTYGQIKQETDGSNIPNLYSCVKTQTVYQIDTWVAILARTAIQGEAFWVKWVYNLKFGFLKILTYQNKIHWQNVM